MRPIQLLAIAAALLSTVPAVEAQDTRVVLEARAGFAVPTGEWNEEDILDNGFGFGGSVKGMVTSAVGVYVGWETYTYRIERADLGDVKANATDAGFRAGVALHVPIPRYPALTPYVEAGGIYNRVFIGASNPVASLEIESDASLGFEAGIGVSVALSPYVSLMPSLRYRQHKADFEGFPELEAIIGRDPTVSYIVYGVGLSFRP